jgi:hypothetical protein
MDRENDNSRLTPLPQMTRDFDAIKIRQTKVEVSQSINFGRYYNASAK